MGLKRWPPLLTLAVVLVLAACGSTNAAPSASSKVTTTGFGRVTGVVYPEHGTYNGFGAHLWFIRSDGQRFPVSVPADSNFSVRLPSGSYTVKARGKMVIVPQGIASCSTEHPVDVRRGITVNVSVGCMGHRAT
jgi:hypothetical protein